MLPLKEIDAALRLIDRELWIITAANGNQRGGLLATWVSAVSIDPERPALLAGLGPNHFTTELVLTSRAFGAHLLRPEQIELAWNFAHGSGRHREKLGGLEMQTNRSGSPILTDCLAWFDCRVFARYDAGDRLFFWADIVEGSQRPPSSPSSRGTESHPLGEHSFFRQLTADQRQTLLADLNSDILVNRPLHEKWRSETPW